VYDGPFMRVITASWLPTATLPALKGMMPAHRQMRVTPG